MLALPFIPMGKIAIHCDRHSDTFTDLNILLSKIPFYTGEYLRYVYYKYTLKKVGYNVTFRYGSYCQYQHTILGNNLLIGYYNCLGKVEIKDNVQLGGFVNVLSGRHQHYKKEADGNTGNSVDRNQLITIGERVWVGSNAVIMNDVGDGCIIGAGSVLVDKATASSIWAGNPARFIKNL